ncbi:MAG: class II aldolase/adducin family protein [Acidimicrobiia bacterium]|nr:class II aldolase/adducin family protein [Acidimicrobiia bacterium]MYH56061.1 class II aldolase/adducin family protein [Acidimicrobiia bacterium]
MGGNNAEFLKEQVADTARSMAAAGLLEAFGHVSSRVAGGFLITSTKPLFEATEADVITVEDGEPVEGPVEAVPLEMPMHAAIYRARPDVGAICRGHPPYAVVWGVTAEPLPLWHGLGGMAGRVVPSHPDIELVKSDGAARSVADSLGEHSALLLAANGCLAVGEDLSEAFTLLWYLEERARVAVQVRMAGLTPTRVRSNVWDRRLQDSAPELVRARQWTQRSFG